MSAEPNTKKYPVATSEVAQIFGIHGSDGQPVAPANSEAVSVAHLPVANLPVVILDAHDSSDADAHGDAPHGNGHGDDGHESTAIHALLDPEQDQDMEKETKRIKLMTIIKVLFPYVIVFLVGIFVYLFFFSSVNFGSLFKSAPAPVSKQTSSLQQLEAKNMTAYNQWISQFYYDVSDKKIIDPNTDNSGNGLSNFQKFLLNLNPKSYDTLGLNMADSEALAQGTNPLTGSPLTDDQKQVVAQYFDMEVVMNKLALAKLQKSGSVAGAYTSTTTGTNGNGVNTQNSSIIPANTQTNNSNQSQTAIDQQIAPVNGNDIQINGSIPGRLNIPDLKVDAPLMWSSDPANFETDLKSGVIHYPGTALPGQIGTSYISGHSSNYAWVKGNYNHVFTQLGDLKDNASFTITVVQQNGKNAILHYVITGRKEYLPTDQAQFQNSGTSVVALSTCWPVGSTARRLVVFGQLTQVER